VRLKRPGGLWRHRDFRNLWAAETISVFGSQIGGFALPLVAIITLDASPFAVSALLVVEFAPFLLISLPAGVWVDRLPRKPILVLGDLGRFAALLTIPIAYWLDALTIWQLYGVGFFFGVCTVFFDVAYQSYLPSLVERTQLVEGNSKLEVSRSASALGGPAFAGVLVDLLRAPVAVLFDAISFLVSALFLFSIRKKEAPVSTRAERKEAKSSMKTELREGLAWVFGNPYLRTVSASTATFNLFGSMFFAILTIYLIRELEMSVAVMGVIFAIGQVGYFLGAIFAGRVSKLLGVGRSILFGAALGIANLLVPLAPQDANRAIPFLVVATVAGSFGVVLYNVTQLSMRQAITPERLQGRMNSTIRFIVWGVMPLGQLVGGALATWFGLRTAIWVGTIGISFAWLPLVFGPLLALKEMPEPYQEPPAPDALDADADAITPGPFPTPTPDEA
jgi:MFS family permease